MSCSILEQAHAGDVNDVREIVLQGGGPDVTSRLAEPGTTVAAMVRPWGSTGAWTTLTATVLNAARRVIAVSLGGTGGWLSTATAGTYEMKYVVTFADGTVLTWPTGDPDRIDVVD